jgi:hypothetical protein
MTIVFLALGIALRIAPVLAGAGLPFLFAGAMGLRGIFRWNHAWLGDDLSVAHLLLFAGIFLVEKELAEGSLSAIEWGGGHLETSVIMIWHAEKWCSPLLNRFRRLAKNMISD